MFIVCSSDWKFGASSVAWASRNRTNTHISVLLHHVSHQVRGVLRDRAYPDLCSCVRQAPSGPACRVQSLSLGTKRHSHIYSVFLFCDSSSENSINSLMFTSMDPGCFHGNPSIALELPFYVNLLLMGGETKESKQSREPLAPKTDKQGKEEGKHLCHLPGF